MSERFKAMNAAEKMEFERAYQNGMIANARGYHTFTGHQSAIIGIAIVDEAECEKYDFDIRKMPDETPICFCFTGFCTKAQLEHLQRFSDEWMGSPGVTECYSRRIDEF